MKSFKSFFNKKHLQTLKPNLDSPSMDEKNGGGGGGGEEIQEGNGEETTDDEEKSSSSERKTAEDGNTSLSARVGSVVAERKRSVVETPPTDDVCPICFGNFNVPCRTPCGHWYCGGCILQYWNFTAAWRPCKCPMCSQNITKLTPESSLYHQHETEVTQVLKNVGNYNRLFVGGFSGLLLKMLATPLLYFKRLFRDMLNPDQPRVSELRRIAWILGIMYSYSPVDFLGIGSWNVIHVFDLSGVTLSLILCVVGLIIQRRRIRNVRELAEIEGRQ